MKTINPVHRSLKFQNKRLLHYSQYLSRKSDKYSNIRLWTFLSTIVVSALLFILDFQVISIGTFLTGILAFSILVNSHNKFLMFYKKINLLSERKKVGVARIELKWEDIPPYVVDTESDNGLFNDLDITGEKSLFRLINDTVSIEGRQLLIEWLSLRKSSGSDAVWKSEIVKELKNFHLLRERLFISMNLFSKRSLSFNRVSSVVNKKTKIKPLNGIIFFSSFLMTTSFVLLFILKETAIIESPLWLIPLILYILIYYTKSKMIDDGFNGIGEISDELNKLSAIVSVAESLKAKNINHVRQILNPVFENNPSTSIKNIQQISSAVLARENALMKIILNLVFPWDIFFYRKLVEVVSPLKIGFNSCIEALIKFDAFNSIAEFSYLNCNYINASITEDRFRLRFQSCGHPLIPSSQRVGNDFSFKEVNEIVIITGSNMSGKSTFLRTIGINLVLAYNGMPVCAEEFTTSFYQVFTCIRINDSVSEGISYFYSEVKRLKELFEFASLKSRGDIIFFIDEIFKGTNNIERLTGSRDFIKSIAGKNVCGFISTHDFELTKLEDEIQNLRNFHFREEVENEVMIFDYKLHPGACPTTNAIRLMQYAGLPVGKPANKSED